MAYVETELPNGGVVVEWVSPPPAPDYKTKGLNQTEYRSLFTLTETIKNDECESYIDDISYDVDGGLSSLNEDAVDVGCPGMTYRQLMRSAYRAFARAVESGVDMDNSIVILSLNCQSRLGLLDFPERKDTILLGKPL